MKKRILSIITAAMIALSFSPSAVTFATDSKTEDKKESGLQVPDKKGTELSKEEALELFKKVKETMGKVESFEIESEVESHMSDITINTKSKESIFVKENISKSVIQSSGKTSEVYIKDGKSYMKFPNESGEEEWTFVKIGETQLGQIFELNEEMLKVLKVEKLVDGGYVIKSTEPMDLKSYYKLYPNAEANMNSFQGVDNLKFEIQLYIEIDKDFYYKTIANINEFEMDKLGKNKTITVQNITNYDNVEKFEFPAELEKAKEFEAPKVAN